MRPFRKEAACTKMTRGKKGKRSNAKRKEKGEKKWKKNWGSQIKDMVKKVMRKTGGTK